MGRRKVTSLGVDWTLPGKKRRFATSTVATRDLIYILAEQGGTVREAREATLWDIEGRDILFGFEKAGYGEELLSDVLANRVKPRK
jgi:hypothetical protein